MASQKKVAGKKKTNDEIPKKMPDSLSNREKKDFAQKIKNLEVENQRLSLENVMLKNKFDLRTIINELSQKEVEEMDEIAIAKDMVKKALEEVDKRHSAEKKDMEKKHEKEIEQLRNKLQGADQQPTQSKNQATNSKPVSPKDIEVLRRETTKEREDAKSEKKALLGEKQKLEAEVQKLQNENEEQKHSHENSKRNQATNSKPLSPKDIHVQLRETTKEREDAKSENKALLKEKQKLEAEIQKMQNENKEKNISYEKTKDLMMKNQATNSKPVSPNDRHVLLRETTKEREGSISVIKAFLTEKHKLETKNEQMVEEVLKLLNDIKEQKQSFEKSKYLFEKALQEADEMHSAEKTDMEKEVLSLKADKDELINNITQLKMEKESLTKQLKINDELLSKRENEITDLNRELANLTTRLREVASTQLTLNHPNMDELSDVFRPTKLSEEYSQLYYNLWTDAFEEQSSKKKEEEEEELITILRKLLLGSYEFCEKVCREFTVQITKSTLALPNSKPKNRDIPIGYKKQLEEIRKNFGVFLRNDVKESYREQNTIEGGNKTKNYVDACVELCWLMVIQEPPVVIETPASKDSVFDTNTYRSFTNTGKKVDFVVWPALRLHQGGPLLAKGVAQGKK